MNWIATLAQVVANERRDRGPGSVVVLDFLSREELLELAPHLRVAFGESWGVYLVGNPIATPEAIPADQAVNLREDLSRRTCFLVIAGEAGAGMQGVYDVAEVMQERDVLQSVRTALRREVRATDRALEQYAWQACLAGRTAESRGGRTDLFLRREVEYFDAVNSAGTLGAAGLELHRLGLVPDADPRPESLAANAQAVRELLRTEKNRPATAADRVVRLKLTDPSLRERLTAYLRDKPIHSLDQWLPGLCEQGLTFDRWQRETDLTEVTALQLVSLRQSSGRPYGWTGLELDKEGGLYFSLREESPHPRLEIRWKAVPESLPEGAVEYRVSLLPVGGGDPFLEEFRPHKAVRNAQQKWQIERDQLAELAIEATVAIQVSVVGREEGDGAIEPVETEELLLTSTQVPETRSTSSAAKLTRSLWDARLESARGGRDGGEWYVLRKQDSLEVHVEDLRRRLPLPEMLLRLEERILQRESDLGVYEATLRADGLVGELTPVDLPALNQDRWQSYRNERGKLFRSLCREVEKRSHEDRKHPLAVEALDLTEHEQAIWDAARSYATTLEGARQQLNGSHEGTREAAHEALAAALRVDSLLLRRADGSPLGWLVAPTHPLRLTWLLAYGALLEHWRHELSGRPRTLRTARLSLDDLAGLVPHLFPAFVAGADGRLWSYAGGLGLYWGLMLPCDSRDPQQDSADVFRALGLDGEVSTTVELSADLAGDKIAEYLGVHPYVQTLQINALNPGDGGFLKKALIRVRGAKGGDEGLHPRFDLRLLPADPNAIAGRHLDSLAAARRRNRRLTDDEMRLFRSVGSAMTPGLQWAQVRSVAALPQAHLSLLIDYFAGHTETVPADQAADVPEVFGLSLPLHTEYREDGGQAMWRRWVAPVGGADQAARHPAKPAMTEWLCSVHRAILLAAGVLVQEPGAGDRLPAVGLTVTADVSSRVEEIHEKCDWVISLDRHLGLEYFDQPQGVLGSVYERYLLDYMPAALEGVSHRLMISTQRTEEILGLLQRGLRTLGLRHDEAACRGVLRDLKAVSGHAAMSLNSPDAGLPDAVALAVARHHLEQSGQLRDGFLLSGEDSGTPCTLVRVCLGRKDRRDVLDIEFLDVRYALNPGFAFGESLRRECASRVQRAAKEWEERFFPGKEPLDSTLRRRRLVRLLRFYLDKAVRYRLLAPETDTALRRWVEELLSPAFDRLGRLRMRCVLCCPSLERDGRIEELLGDVVIHVLGARACPSYLVDASVEEQLEGRPPAPAPDEKPLIAEPSPERPTELAEVAGPPETPPDDAAPAGRPTEEQPTAAVVEPPDEVAVYLGENERRGREVAFRASVRGNPHLLIVGIPGMGKTTALVNLAASLARQGVGTLTVDFHGDLTTQLRERISDLPFLHLDAATGLTFNPLQLSLKQARRPHGWMDNVFEITEILNAIFPDFGDLQIGEIRSRLIRAYKEAGFREDAEAEEMVAPPFCRVYELFQADAEGRARLQQIVTRLETLFLRRLFRDAPEEIGVEDLASGVTVLDVHGVSSEQNQLAAASFFLHKVYKDMFGRGESPRLRQAIIFDEAHRAAKLGLLGTMMQECRKFGIMMVVSSQRVSDFRRQVVETVGSYLVLRVNHPDARTLAPILAGQEGREAVLRRMLDLPRYHALFRSEQYLPYIELRLRAP